ncbi:MAG: NAD(P)-dependent oxidoreductase [Crocinitomicaceae bacterium]|nr:NAD(P)-dependent oxidoreductase [Crocinitomicaceae bacterium]
MKSKHILVLGATGFIGSKLCFKLNSESDLYKITRFDSKYDLSNRNIIDEITRLNPDVIIVSAGKSFVPESWNNPEEFFKINSTGMLHVAEAARISKSNVVYLSTFVYGNPIILPITENNQVRPLNPYSASKLIGEQILEYYYRFFGVSSNVIRVFNIYGPGQSEKFLIPILIRQFKFENKIEVKDLKPKRDYLHVDDLINLIIRSANLFDGFQIFNAGSGKSISVEELIELIFKAGGRRIRVFSSDEVRPNEIMDTCANISRAKEIFNWSPNISIEEGISDLLK